MGARSGRPHRWIGLVLAAWLALTPGAASGRGLAAGGALPPGRPAIAEAGSGRPGVLRTPAEAAQIVRRLDRVARWAPGLVSVWYYDLTTHEYFGVRADEEHTAASTVKVLIAGYLYHQAAAGRLSLDEPLAIRPVDWKDGSGILNGVPDGTRLPLREVARLMLVHSDNTAANALLRRLGVQPMVQYYRSLGVRYGSPGMRTPQDLWQGNRIAPEDLGIVLRNIWEAARRSPDPWAELLTFMQQSRSKGRIPAGLPPGVPVANKTGSKGTSFHDAAIVLDRRRPYVLVVMTRGMTAPEASAAIARVSREVWEWHGRRAPQP